MKFDVFGRFQLEVAREDGRWVAYKLALGKRVRWPELAIPSTLASSLEISTYLDDLYHEMAGPGQSVREFK